MTDNKIFVLAGNYEQYQMFSKQLINAMSADHLWFRLGSIVYIGGPDTIRGIRDPWGYKVGTWKDRKDINEIVEQLMVAGSSVDNDFIEVEL